MPVPDRRILGVKFAVLNRSQAIELVGGALDSGKQLKVAFANANTLNLAFNDAAYRLALDNFLILNDGIGVDLASWMKFGCAFPDNLNGTDFVPSFLSAVCKPLRIYLIGSSAEAARQACAGLAERWPRHRIVGWQSGFFHCQHEIDEACSAIQAANPDVLLVGMGNPQQELWIAHNAETTGAKLALGVGALVDFLAGRVTRAPRIIRNARCEWIFRLALEPRRLARRYLIGNLLFLLRAFRESYNVRLQ
jgi:alpha-1,3-mannosyltransferase